jgi:hypothetical protein
MKKILFLVALAANLIFAILLVAVMLRENYPQRVYNNFFYQHRQKNHLI